MLVLSRKKNETIVLPELGITIMVTEVRGDKVRIGIEAPRDITVLRGEIEECPPDPPDLQKTLASDHALAAA